MSTFKFVVFGVVLAAAFAEPPVFSPNGVSSSYGPPPQEDFGGYGGGYGGGDSGSYGGSQEGYGQNHLSKPYEFGYSVKDPNGLDYGREETGDGHNVRGSYRVLLPDGRTQIVTYHADWKSGFHADVRYEGEAQYPEQGSQTDSDGYQYSAPSQPFTDGNSGYNQAIFKR